MKNNFSATGIGRGMLPANAQLVCLDESRETDDH